MNEAELIKTGRDLIAEGYCGFNSYLKSHEQASGLWHDFIDRHIPDVDEHHQEPVSIRLRQMVCSAGAFNKALEDVADDVASLEKQSAVISASVARFDALVEACRAVAKYASPAARDAVAADLAKVEAKAKDVWQKEGRLAKALKGRTDAWLAQYRLSSAATLVIEGGG